MYCKALVEIYALKVKPCFVGISGAQEPVFLMGCELGWAARPADLVQDLPLAHTLLLASALDLPKPRLLCLSFPFLPVRREG